MKGCDGRDNMATAAKNCKILIVSGNKAFELHAGATFRGNIKDKPIKVLKLSTKKLLKLSEQSKPLKKRDYSNRKRSLLKKADSPKNNAEIRNPGHPDHEHDDQDDVENQDAAEGSSDDLQRPW